MNDRKLKVRYVGAIRGDDGGTMANEVWLCGRK